MLYSCTHVASVGVKGVNDPSQSLSAVRRPEATIMVISDCHSSSLL